MPGWLELITDTPDMCITDPNGKCIIDANGKSEVMNGPGTTPGIFTVNKASDNLAEKCTKELSDLKNKAEETKAGTAEIREDTP